MSTSAAIKSLPTLSLDQLVVGYQQYNQAAIAAPAGSRSASINMNRREAVRAEIARRGWIIRRSRCGGLIQYVVDRAT
jgi:hypothetical protein